MATLIIVLIIVLLVTVFSVQNAAPVAIAFLFWRFEASLAIVIFLSVLSGILIASIFILWLHMKKKGKKDIKEEKAENEI